MKKIFTRPAQLVLALICFVGLVQWVAPTNPEQSVDAISAQIIHVAQAIENEFPEFDAPERERRAAALALNLEQLVYARNRLNMLIDSRAVVIEERSKEALAKVESLAASEIAGPLTIKQTIESSSRDDGDFSSYAVLYYARISVFEQFQCHILDGEFVGEQVAEECDRIRYYESDPTYGSASSGIPYSVFVDSREMRAVLYRKVKDAIANTESLKSLYANLEPTVVRVVASLPKKEQLSLWKNVRQFEKAAAYFADHANTEARVAYFRYYFLEKLRADYRATNHPSYRSSEVVYDRFAEASKEFRDAMLKAGVEPDYYAFIARRYKDSGYNNTIPETLEEIAQRFGAKISTNHQTASR